MRDYKIPSLTTDIFILMKTLILFLLNEKMIHLKIIGLFQEAL